MTGDSGRDPVTTLSAVALVGGLLVSAGLLMVWGHVIAMFVAAGVLPTVLGYAGLAREGALPWHSSAASADDEEDLVEELKRRYAKGELDEAEMERKVETLLAADEADERAGVREREFGRRR